MWCIKLTVALCFLPKSMKVYLTALTLSLPENLCCWCSLFKEVSQRHPQTFILLSFGSPERTREARSPACCPMTSFRQIQNMSSRMSYDVIKAAKGLNVILSSVDFPLGCAPLIRSAGYVICTLCCAYCLPLFLAKFTSLNCITGLCRWHQTWHHTLCYA